jgi:O-acetyl-ADP-ribose deacetylase (regulator of RNase III)
MTSVVTGNLLEAKTDALVNTVNTVGVMGKGIALQFRQAFPKMFSDYARACKRKEVVAGRMHIFETGSLENPKFIINFPTKRHWRGKSLLGDIDAGLKALLADITRLKIKSIAIPPLGCGNGGLEWKIVLPRIQKAFSALPDVKVLIFAPNGAPAFDSIKIGTEKPAMSRGRALLILALEKYFLPGYRSSLLEVQKLTYFLQETGERLRLVFRKNQFGPYAENLNHVLQATEGHYTRGYGDRSLNRRAEIFVLPGAAEEARRFIGDDHAAKEHLRQVAELVKGYENPYGMELLATIHWLSKEFPEIATNKKMAVIQVKAWNSRKERLFGDEDIECAWERLRSQSWFTNTSLLRS